MQKAIRRGERDMAVDAALSLYALRGRATWRRLILVACEDVGIGDTVALTASLSFASNASARQAFPSETHALVHVVQLLAHAAKDRSADYLISAATVSPVLEVVREQCGSLGAASRIEMALSTTLPLPERAVATWYGSGLNAGRESRFSHDNLQQLLMEFAAHGVPADLCAAVSDAARITREPMVVMLPLIWLAAQNRHQTVRQNEMPPAPSAAGIPSYALDKHTRLGKAAIAKLLRDDEQTREMLLRVVPEFRLRAATEMAAFYVDAVPVRSQLDWVESDALFLLGRDADMWKAQVPASAVPAVMDAMQAAVGKLNEIRIGLLLRASHP